MNCSYPMLIAAQSQGRNVLSHISSGAIPGSGFVVGPSKPATGYISRPTTSVVVGPTAQPSGPNRNVVGPG
jgi:hypothetical protein